MLSLVREVGEVSNRVLLRAAMVEARRGLYNVSSVAGLRWLAGVPAAELMRSRHKRAAGTAEAGVTAVSDIGIPLREAA
jgi:hypothetical protein